MSFNIIGIAMLYGLRLWEAGGVSNLSNRELPPSRLFWLYLLVSAIIAAVDYKANKSAYKNGLEV